MFAAIKMLFVRFLRRIELYTRTDLVYVLHGGFWLTLAKVTGMLTSVLVAIAMANLISPEVFGVYRFVIAGAGIIAAFSLTGMSSVIIQAVARNYEGAFRAGVKSYLRWSFLPTLMSLGVASYYLTQGNGTLAFGFFLVAIFNPLLNAYSFFSQFLTGKKDFRTQALFDCIADTVPAVALIATVLVTENPLIILMIYFLAGIATNISLHIATVKKFQPNDATDPETLPFAKHLSFMGILGKIGENIDKILVFHYLGAAPLAMYAFAQTPIAQLKLLADIPVKIALPKLSERDYSVLKTSLPRKIFLLMGLMVIAVVAYIAVAPLVFELFFPEYTDAVIYTQILALSLVFTPGVMFTSALAAHMKKRELYISQAILPALKIGLFVVLLPLYGIWGVIAVSIAHQFITFVVYGVLFWKASSDAR